MLLTDASYFKFYQFEEEKDVYDIVDEDKYAQIVQERQEEDFIVDDGELKFFILIT